MHFEFHFSEYKSIIMNLELSTLSYFLVGLGVGICSLLLYNYIKKLNRG